jgi:GIY-YIG catalytic domain
MIVYLLLNTVNLKGYVGQHKGNKISGRWPKNLRSGGANIHLANACDKYGPDAFSREILNVCSSQEEMNNLERLWIVTLRTYDPKFGYNETYGGEGGRLVVYTEEMRKKLSDANPYKGKPGGFRQGKKQPREAVEACIRGIHEYWSKKSPEEASQHMKYAGSFVKYDEKFRQRCRENKTGTKDTQQTKDNKSTAQTNRWKKQKEEGVVPYFATLTGTMWITNGIQNKRILKGSPVDEGWRKGVTLRVGPKPHSQTTIEKMSIITEKRMASLSPEERTKITQAARKAHKDKIAINNGLEWKWISKFDPVDEGWKRGWIKH